MFVGGHPIPYGGARTTLAPSRRRDPRVPLGTARDSVRARLVFEGLPKSASFVFHHCIDFDHDAPQQVLTRPDSRGWQYSTFSWDAPHLTENTYLASLRELYFQPIFPRTSRCRAASPPPFALISIKMLDVYAATTGTATVSTTPTSVPVAPSGTSTSEYDGGDAGGGGTSPGLIGCIVAGVVIGLLALLFGLSRTKRYKRIRAKRSDANRVSSLGQSWPETSHGYAHNGKDEDSGLNHARLTRLLQDSHGVRLSGTTVASQLLSPVFPDSRVSKLRVVNDTSSTHNSEQGEYVAASVTEVDESPDLNLQQVHRFADFTAGGYRPMRLVVHGSQADMGDVDSVEETGDYDETVDRHPEVVEGSVASPTEDIQPAVAPLGGDAVKTEDQPGHDDEQQEPREVGLGLGFVGKSAF
ncbi:hypothetical protein QBC37DRAFT_461261 [Rhypophila decipiens]|uniref:Uncharacterized protein n=1 Tax=Rhypophila decipiens TaxID=261697 RepID=A0AAN7B955_9PEZI|nr:hypothetical protein QBC37DRAFT_461261 [Rhypophila decipiens]